MRTLRTISCGTFILVALALTPGESRAWGRCGGGFRIGIGIGIPIGGYGYGYYPYYPYYPYPPVVVAPPPVVVQPGCAAPAAVTSGAPPAPAAAPLEQAPPPRPVPLQPTSATDVPSQNQIGRYLQQLQGPDDRTRLDAAVQLGRLRSLGAVDALAATLAADKSPAVREGAARALGMIGSAKALPDLQRAALADSDSTVRHTAQFCRRDHPVARPALIAVWLITEHGRCPRLGAPGSARRLRRATAPAIPAMMGRTTGITFHHEVQYSPIRNRCSLVHSVGPRHAGRIRRCSG